MERMLPPEVRTLRPVQLERLELALDLEDVHVGPAAIIAQLVTLFGSTAGIVAILAGSPAVGIGVLALVACTIGMAIHRWRQRTRQRHEVIAKELAWARQQPMPVNDYAYCLTCEQLWLDVVSASPVARALEDAVHTVDRNIGVHFLDDTTVRLTVPPRTKRVGREELAVCDRAAVHALFERVLLPVHRTAPIQRVTMGGSTPSFP